MCEKRLSDLLHPGHVLMTRDAIHIKGHPNINMENEMVSSGSRKPLIHLSKNGENLPTRIKNLFRVNRSRLSICWRSHLTISMFH
jgi:hypothetical protein